MKQEKDLLCYTMGCTQNMSVLKINSICEFINSHVSLGLILYCKTQRNLEITRFAIFFSEKQAPVRNNYGSTKSYIFSLKYSCDTNLIQCGNEKEEKKRGKKFTNRYLLQKIQRKKYYNWDLLVNSLKRTQ